MKMARIPPFDLVPRTPFWTGDIDRDSSHLRMTGLLGSMRWWYAGLIRALGGKTCAGQPNGEPCIYEHGKSEKICPVCRLFGSTGHARLFRLTGNTLQPQQLGFTSSKDVYRANSFWLWQTYGGEASGGSKRRGRDGTDYQFGVNCLWGEGLRLQISCNDEIQEKIVPIIKYLLDFLSKYGGLGAKIQNGFGVFKLDHHTSDFEIIHEGKKRLLIEAREAENLQFKPDDPKALNIRNFFSFQFELEDFEKFAKYLKAVGAVAPESFNPSAFDLRYKYRLQRPGGLRDLLKIKKGKGSASEMLGNSKARSDDERWASKIFISHPFREADDWHLRVYGYVPPLSDYKLDYAEMTELIRDFYFGPKGIFPGSRRVRQFDFKKEFPDAEQA
jgi:CRISPR-associated protein Cmr1